MQVSAKQPKTIITIEVDAVELDNLVTGLCATVTTDSTVDFLTSVEANLFSDLGAELASQTGLTEGPA